MPRRDRPLLPLLPLLLALALLAGAWWWRRPGRETVPAVARPEVPAVAEEEMPMPAVWATDIGVPGAGGWQLDATVPDKLWPGQKRPPCTPRLEREIKGGCWLVSAAKPPCPENSFTHGELCVVPMFAAKRPPTSFGE